MELKKEVESLLFSSGKVMNEKELAELTNSSENGVRTALENLKKEYDDRDTSLMLVQSGDKWKLNVREKYMNLVTKIVADTELPFPVLETLAVIAFKAPVLQADIVKTRGTNAYEQIGVLVKEEFVDKRKEGRSFRLSLTPKFFKYFDVEGEKDIKEALKDVKVPEKKIPKKIGDLDVVDMPAEKEKEKEKKKLGDLEVVDETESEKDSEASKTESLSAKDESLSISSEMKQPEQTEEAEEKEDEEDKEEKISIENNKPDTDFLKSMEERIDELRARNDELDQDELFKRQEEVSKEMEGEAEKESKEIEEEKEGAEKEIEKIEEELEKEKKEIEEKTESDESIESSKKEDV